MTILSFILMISLNVLKNGSEVFLYKDDTKIYGKVKTLKDMKLLQEDIDCMREWSNKWLLTFHPNKWKFMHIGNCNAESDGYSMNVKIIETSSEKDIYRSNNQQQATAFKPSCKDK